jgi:hypothetical protein
MSTLSSRRKGQRWVLYVGVVVGAVATSWAAYAAPLPSDTRLAVWGLKVLGIVSIAILLLRRKKAW